MAKIEANWTEADMRQAEAMANALEDCCAECGDGTEPGHEQCAACEKNRAEATRPRVPGDNHRASMRYPRSRYR